MDIFKSLTKGAKFSTSKHKDTIDLFKGKVANQNGLAADLFSSSCSTSTSKKNVDNTISSSNTNCSDVANSTYNFDREDEINAFRNRLRIKVKGEHIPNPSAEFHDMSLHKDIKKIILKNIETSYWKEPTPIQMQAIPIILENRDILACAPTGSGKTAAYVIPTLSKLTQPLANHGIRALLLAPTKELADQVFREVTRLGEGKRFKVCNLKKNVMNQALSTQGKTLFNKFDVLIATPLRLVSIIRAKVIDLSKVEIIVLDEADKLLDVQGKQDDDDEIMEVVDDEENDDGDKKKKAKSLQKRVRSAFLNQVDEILAECPSVSSPPAEESTKKKKNKNQASVPPSPPPIKLQRCLFSATIGPFVKELAEQFLQNPVHLTIGTENAGANTINQRLVFVGREDGKLLAIRQLIQEGLKPPVLLFLQSIDRSKELFQELAFDGINVDVMHSNRSAAQREEVMQRFRRGEIWVLICTDLMARGIDFQGVQMVINYDLPNTAVNYIHRIGRTGRAGRKGEAVTFFTEDDIPRLRPIANVVKLSGCSVPDWMLAIKPVSGLNLSPECYHC